MCFSVTLHIVDLWQYYVCCTICTFFMVFYLSRMCQYVLQAVLWSHIGTHIRILAAEPRSIAGLLTPFQYLCGTILVTPYSMVCDWRVSRAGVQCLLIGLAARSVYVSCCFTFLFFHSMGWYCGAEVFGLIWC